MAQSAGLHEAGDHLSPDTIDRHRAIASIQEELEAVDWYDQRVDATADPELAAVLAHNRDEEKEHAAMTLEWLRRRDPVLDHHLRTYLFTEGSVLAVEEATSASGGPAAEGDASLRIGDLRGTSPDRSPTGGRASSGPDPRVRRDVNLVRSRSGPAGRRGPSEGAVPSARPLPRPNEQAGPAPRLNPRECTTRQRKESHVDNTFDASLEHGSGHSVVSVTGEVDVAAAAAFRERLDEAIGGAPGLLVVDLTDVTFIDSTALGCPDRSASKHCSSALGDLAAGGGRTPHPEGLRDHRAHRALRHPTHVAPRRWRHDRSRPAAPVGREVPHHAR